MKLTKKLLAIMLSLIMVFTMIAVPVSAAGTIAEDTAVEEVVGEETTDEEAAEEDFVGQFHEIFEAIKNLIEAIHNLVGGIMGNLGKECPFCGEVHEKNAEEDEEMDLETDTDKDGIPDDVEELYGADPKKEDTDNDGLSDYWELNWLELKPDNDDSDGDGILDIDEDTDGDGIKNLDEINYNTDPSFYDTDFDNLSDYDEIFVYKTDPTKEDTDGDGASDGDEIFGNTDPLTSEKTFVSEVLNQEPTEDIPVVADAKIIGDAESLNSLSITPITSADDIRLNRNIAGYLGYAYDFSVEGKMDTAEITFNYDESLGTIGKEFQPRIYYFNEETGELVELPNQKVTNGRVSVEVEHFSTYILLNKVEFDAAWVEIKPPSEENSTIKGLDVVFVIDSSGSMSSNDGSGLRRVVARKFVEKLGENDRAAVVDFDSSASLYAGFTSDHTVLDNAINRINSSGGTNLSKGMDLALKQFTNSDYTNTDVYKYIIMLTDGQGSYSASYTQTAIDNNIVVYTVGLGSGVDQKLLEQIADSTGGKYYFASTNTDLYDIYEKIENETIDYTTDSNDDKISDYYTKLLYEGKLTVEGSNMIFGTDLNYDMDGNKSDDFDGDGIINGEEIKIVERGNKVTVQLITNPLMNDTDLDGYDDYKEIYVMKTSPLKTTVDDFAINQLLNNSNYTYRDFAHDNEFLKGIYQVFDAQKKKDAVFTMTNYFYEYASEESIDQNKDAIAKLAKKEKALEIFEVVVNIASTAKNFADAGTKAGSDVKKVDKLKDDAFTAKNSMLKKLNDKTNNKKLEDTIEIGEPILEEFIGLESTFTDIGNAISEPDWKEVTGAIKSATGLIVDTVSLAKAVKTKWVLKIKGLNKFANKYQAWMKSAPDWAGGVTNGTMVGIAFDVVDLGIECAEINNTYGKLIANSQAFENYIDVIEYMSENGNDKKFIKKAAGEVMAIVLDKSNETYYKKVAAACGTETGITVAKVAVSVVGDFCPYVKAAELILDGVIILFSLTGISAMGVDVSTIQTIDAISDGCVYHCKKKVKTNNGYYDYLSEDTESYFTQLAQSRIVGEKALCDHLVRKNLSAWLERVFEGANIKEVNSLFGMRADFVYGYSEDLGLVLSPNLPAFVNNKWTTNEHRGGHGGGGGSW